jgi:hypothetical protein
LKDLSAHLHCNERSAAHVLLRVTLLDGEFNDQYRTAFIPLSSMDAGFTPQNAACCRCRRDHRNGSGLSRWIFSTRPGAGGFVRGLLLQIGSNLANDVYDYERGADAGERHGPMRVTQAQLLTPGQVKAGMLVVFGLSALLGLYLAFGRLGRDPDRAGGHPVGRRLYRRPVPARLLWT